MNKPITLIPNTLRKHRKRRGLSQKEVAKILELKSASIISRWERGVCLPNTPNLFRLTVLYRTMPEALFFQYLGSVKEEIQRQEERVHG